MVDFRHSHHVEEALLLAEWHGMVKKNKPGKTQPGAKNSVLKTCVIMTSFLKTDIEEINEVRKHRY